MRIKTLSTFGDFVKFAPLTFPCLRRQYGGAKNYLGIGIEDERPLAYLLAYFSRKLKTADILSVFVNPEYRLRGFGTNLIRRLEEELSIFDIRSVSTQFCDESIGLRQLFEQCGWQVYPSQSLCKIGSEGLQAPWVYRDFKLPTDYRIVPWAEVNDSMKFELWQNHSQNPWIPQEVMPWKHDACWHPSTSFGLLCGSRLTGWLITHKLKPDLLRYSCAYCEDGIRQKASMVAVFAAAIRQQAREMEAPRAIWTIYPDQPQMLAFVKRHLVPFGASIMNGFESWKILQVEK
jgi:GNAT superfamily N-acetyltransferase